MMRLCTKLFEPSFPWIPGVQYRTLVNKEVTLGSILLTDVTSDKEIYLVLDSKKVTIKAILQKQDRLREKHANKE